MKEMDLLVAPLYTRIGDNIIFQKGAQSNIDSQRPRDKEYLKFWDEVKRNKYLAPDYLRSAITNYLKNKSDTVGDRERDESYIIAEDKLFKEIEKRYNELTNELSVL
jgi:pyruvate/2-oxoacid:ferredoxin oxidoreductase alpha subunit